MEEFLLTLKRGIVVRRHRPNAESAFIKLFSSDGGDTIQFRHVQSDEAMIAFKEQAVRFNRYGGTSKRNEAAAAGASQRWARENSTDLDREEQDNIQNFNLPDFIAAEKYRAAWSRTQGNVKKKVADMATRAMHRGEVKTADIVAVHPAINPDPFSPDDDDPDTSTISMRASPSEFVQTLSFSLVLPGTLDRIKGNQSTKSLSTRWGKGEGSGHAFRYLDIETATDGEYWLIFRGLVLLHRDADKGRFAAQRAQGIGSNYASHEIDQMEQQRNRLIGEAAGANGKNGLDGGGVEGFLDEYVEPSKKNIFDRLSKTLHFGPSQTLKYQPVNAPPPPSDYFLGFKSPGTQIWSRLRQSGLETQRIYALDTRKVMLKIRCPAERLMDVAEVLRLKLRTKEGTFEPFKESLISHYLPTDESSSVRLTNESALFRSSDRQTIIDFIIRSRIRDSGAELGPRTDLGKTIASRVPLHKHARLDPLYECWVQFWKVQNWDGRDGKSMRVGRDREELINKHGSNTDDALNHGEEDSPPSFEIPSFFNRLFTGCWHQPLDSIEEYYGEKVAFYFAWLQHVSFHLIFMSILGWAVFICQLASGNWDHPIRPFFSAFLMLWSFVVMVTWRKRSNFLAHRWGTLNYQEEEITRPQFSGTYKFDEITQEWTVYYPSWKRWIKYAISFPLTVLFTLVTLVGILMLYANRDIALARYFDSKENPDQQTFDLELNLLAIGRRSPINIELSTERLKDSHFWLVIGGFPLVLGLTLPLLNFILMRISVLLTEFENYRTETQFRNHLIVKVFSFRFVCYFAALYYYAFIATSTDENATENGILRVATSLFIYVTVAHWWTIFLQVYAPMLIVRWRIYRERLALRDVMRDVEAMEEEFTESGRALSTAERKHRQKRLINSRLLLEQAQSNIWEEMMLPNHDSFPEYIVAVVQFAYVTCFSTALPVAPFIVLINHLLAMRLDAYKLCRGRRRPQAQKTGGIGIWEHVLHIVTVVAVFTNCTLMAMTSSLFKELGDKIGNIGLFVVAICWEHVMLLIKYIMQATISPFPKEVIDEQRREKYQLARKRTSNLRAKKQRRSGSLKEQGVAVGGHRDGIPVRDRLRPTPSKSSRNLTGSLPTLPEASPLMSDNGPSGDVDRGQSADESSSEVSPLLERAGEDTPLSYYQQKRDTPGLRRRNVACEQKKSPLRQMKKSTPAGRSIRAALTPTRSNRSNSPKAGGSRYRRRGSSSEDSVFGIHFPRHDEISPSAPPLSPDTENYSISDIVDDDATMNSFESANTWNHYSKREQEKVEASLAAEERIKARLSHLQDQPHPAGAQSTRRRRRRKDR